MVEVLVEEPAWYNLAGKSRRFCASIYSYFVPNIEAKLAERNSALALGRGYSRSTTRDIDRYDTIEERLREEYSRNKVELKRLENHLNAIKNLLPMNIRDIIDAKMTDKEELQKNADDEIKVIISSRDSMIKTLEETKAELKALIDMDIQSFSEENKKAHADNIDKLKTSIKNKNEEIYNLNKEIENKSSNYGDKINDLQLKEDQLYLYKKTEYNTYNDYELTKRSIMRITQRNEELKALFETVKVRGDISSLSVVSLPSADYNKVLITDFTNISSGSSNFNVIDPDTYAPIIKLKNKRKSVSKLNFLTNESNKRSESWEKLLLLEVERNADIYGQFIMNNQLEVADMLKLFKDASHKKRDQINEISQIPMLSGIYLIYKNIKLVRKKNELVVDWENITNDFVDYVKTLANDINLSFSKLKSKRDQIELEDVNNFLSLCSTSFLIQSLYESAIVEELNSTIHNIETYYAATIEKYSNVFRAKEEIIRLCEREVSKLPIQNGAVESLFLKLKFIAVLKYQNLESDINYDTIDKMIKINRISNKWNDSGFQLVDTLVDLSNEVFTKTSEVILTKIFLKSDIVAIGDLYENAKIQGNKAFHFIHSQFKSSYLFLNGSEPCSVYNEIYVPECGEVVSLSKSMFYSPEKITYNCDAPKIREEYSYSNDDLSKVIAIPQNVEFSGKDYFELSTDHNVKSFVSYDFNSNSYNLYTMSRHYPTRKSIELLERSMIDIITILTMYDNYKAIISLSKSTAQGNDDNKTLNIQLDEIYLRRYAYNNMIFSLEPLNEIRENIFNLLNDSNFSYKQNFFIDMVNNVLGYNFSGFGHKWNQITFYYALSTCYVLHNISLSLLKIKIASEHMKRVGVDDDISGKIDDYIISKSNQVDLDEDEDAVHEKSETELMEILNLVHKNVDGLIDQIEKDHVEFTRKREDVYGLTRLLFDRESGIKSDVYNKQPDFEKVLRDFIHAAQTLKSHVLISSNTDIRNRGEMLIDKIGLAITNEFNILFYGWNVDDQKKLYQFLENRVKHYSNKLEKLDFTKQDDSEQEKLKLALRSVDDELFAMRLVVESIQKSSTQLRRNEVMKEKLLFISNRISYIYSRINQRSKELVKKAKVQPNVTNVSVQNAFSDYKYVIEDFVYDLKGWAVGRVLYWNAIYNQLSSESQRQNISIEEVIYNSMSQTNEDDLKTKLNENFVKFAQQYIKYVDVLKRDEPALEQQNLNDYSIEFQEYLEAIKENAKFFVKELSESEFYKSVKSGIISFPTDEQYLGGLAKNVEDYSKELCRLDNKIKSDNSEDSDITVAKFRSVVESMRNRKIFQTC